MMNGNGIIRWLIVALLGVFVAGCASMDEDECRVADWYAIGYEDGARGASASHLSERREACAEYGIAPNFAQYKQGRDEGLREYCAPASGYRLGRSGKTITSACPSDLQADFKDAYKSGRRVYQAAAVVNSTRSKLRRKRQELEDIRSSLTSKSSEIIAPGTGTERRLELLVEMQALNSRKNETEKEIERLSADLDRHREKLAALEHSSAY